MTTPSLEQRQILVTGGTGGLGRGVVQVLLAQGAQLTVTAQSQADIDQSRTALNGLGCDLDRIRFVPVDLSQEEAVRTLVMGMSRIDALAHLVGGFSMGPTSRYSLDQWKYDLDLNLTIAFLCCKHALWRMEQQGYGRIVAISSRGSVQPGAQLAGYCAAKAGLNALIQVIAAETRQTEITANAVLPSVIDTPANRQAMGEAEADQWVTPESLGAVIAFLCSPAAGDLRGALVPVYGSV